MNNAMNLDAITNGLIGVSTIAACTYLIVEGFDFGIVLFMGILGVVLIAANTE